jgi:hypothetical protein
MVATSSLDELQLIRRTIVTAIAADDVLMERLVLKGGNALEIAWRYSARASLDVDYSMEGEGLPPAELEQRLFRSLRDRFDAAGYVPVDEMFDAKPRGADGERVLGYRVTFKIVDKSAFASSAGDLRKLRMSAVDIAGVPGSGKSFTIEISKNEYLAEKATVDIDSFRVHVYTPAMIVAEKLRALCQQLPSLALREHPAERARDFYDIHTVVSRQGLNMLHHLETVRSIFGIKKVPLQALQQIAEQREFHRHGWPSVKNSVLGEIQDYEFYFAFVCDLVGSILEPLGVVDAPS